jgi:hypothetical protein
MATAETVASSILPASFCDDTCWGWAAALLAAVAFGSFGVPIKSEAARSVDIDPLVFQTYKTTMCFLTSWLVVWYFVSREGTVEAKNESFLTFTPWGIVAGLFWVQG